MKPRTFLFSLLVLSLFAGCTNDDTPVSAPNEVDPALLGAWYKVDTVRVTHPSPPTVFTGMRINTDKTLQSLGVEVLSGRVALMDKAYPRRILQAQHGLLILQTSTIPGGYDIDTILYGFQHDQLVFVGGWRTGYYRRTQVGASVADPVGELFSVRVDSLPVSNLPIGTTIPAYVSKVTVSSLQVFAWTSNGYISIDIDGYSGPGTYRIGPYQGKMVEIDGDLVAGYSTDSSSVGNLMIDSYDEMTRWCTGRFAFDACLGPPKYKQWKRLREGVFSLPVYK